MCLRLLIQNTTVFCAIVVSVSQTINPEYTVFCAIVVSVCQEYYNNKFVLFQLLPAIYIVGVAMCILGVCANCSCGHVCLLWVGATCVCCYECGHMCLL